jgi:hypothetical protein
MAPCTDKEGHDPSINMIGWQVTSTCGLSMALGSRNFQKFHHQTYGSCYTFKGFWTAQHPGITHGE